MIRHALPLAFFALTSCSEPLPMAAHATNLLAEVAPGIRLGARTEDLRSHGHQLALAPYFGWRDTTHGGGDSVPTILLRVDERLSDESHRPSPRARIDVVVVETSDSTRAVALEQRAQSVLGRAPARCFAVAPQRVVREIAWPDGRGTYVVFSAPASGWTYVQPTSSGPQSMRDRASLSFGAARPDSTRWATPVRCPDSLAARAR